MTTAIVLIVIGAISRLLPHPPNFVAMGALALFAGARLPKRWAWAVPLLAMIASDLIIDWVKGNPIYVVARLISYASFALIVPLGFLARRTDRALPLRWLGLSVGASTLFFLASNFGVWITPVVGQVPELLYPATFAGLVQCYAAALPFFGNTLAADLAGTGVLFGLDTLARSVAASRMKPAAVLVAADHD